MNRYSTDKTQLHCGACMENFSDVDELNSHIKYCPAAIVLLPFIHQVWNGNDSIGHPTSHLISALHQNANLIKRYISHVVNDVGVLKRAELHIRLCKELDLDYEDFRPFESEKITKRPTFQEAQIFFWEAVAEKLYNGLEFKKPKLKSV